MNKISIAVSVAALLMYGCSDKPKEQNNSAETKKVQSSTKAATTEAPKTIYGASAEQTPKKAPTDSDMQLNTPHIANVLETINGGGYTYAKVDEKGNIYWIAGPESNIVVGSSISFIEQMVMENFTSKALNKTFDQLVFVSTMLGSEKSAKDDAHKNCDHDKEVAVVKPVAPAAHATPAQPATPTSVKVAKNSSGYSVEELYLQKDDLNTKNIKVDAKVVKVSKNIMGKDWVHLQDGSGSAGTNDIIATSKNSTVKVGDTVTAEGIVKTDVDLGYGYKFSVMIEDTKFKSIN